MRNFFFIGAGFIFQKHLEAIKQSDAGKIIGVYNPTETVGLIGNYSNDAIYTRKLNRDVLSLFKDYECTPVIISPTYTHYSYLKKLIKFGFKEIIVEKPPVLTLKELYKVIHLANQYDCKVIPVLQTRYSSENVEATRELIRVSDTIEIDYFTPRGLWYYNTWKASEKKSGGLIMNIGIHIIDFIVYVLKSLNDHIAYARRLDISSMDTLLSFKTSNDKLINISLSIDNRRSPKREIKNKDYIYKLVFDHKNFYESLSYAKTIDDLKELYSIYELIKQL